jgi:hypothetical protein
MKTLLILVIVCCDLPTDNGYKYEAKNTQTNQTGDFYTTVKYSEGDTVKIEIR